MHAKNQVGFLFVDLCRTSFYFVSIGGMFSD